MLALQALPELVAHLNAHLAIVAVERGHKDVRGVLTWRTTALLRLRLPEQGRTSERKREKASGEGRPASD